MANPIKGQHSCTVCGTFRINQEYYLDDKWVHQCANGHIFRPSVNMYHTPQEQNREYYNDLTRGLFGNPSGSGGSRPMW